MILPYKNFVPKIHKEAFIAPTATLIGRVEVAKDASVWFGTVLRGDINEVIVGKRSNVQDNSVFHVEKNTPCIIKDDVTVGHMATVHACTVESGCLIGIGAVVLNHALIGKWSIVGAHATVLQGVKIPPYSMVVGTPAKVVRKLTDAEIDHLKWSSQNYVNISAEYKRNPEMLLHSRTLTPLTDLSKIF